MTVVYDVVAIPSRTPFYNASSRCVTLNGKLIPFVAAHLLETKIQHPNGFEKLKALLTNASLTTRSSCVVYPPDFNKKEDHYFVVNEHEVDRWLASIRPTTCHILTSPRADVFVLHGE